MIMLDGWTTHTNQVVHIIMNKIINIQRIKDKKRGICENESWGGQMHIYNIYF